MTKNIIIVILVLAVVGLGGYMLLGSGPFDSRDVVEEDPFEDVLIPPEGDAEDFPEEEKTELVIGTSVGGREIRAYRYGEGEDEILLVGGIHGGYSWNTSLVLYEAMDYLKTNPDAIPANVRVTVVPVLNPDGLSQVVDVSDGRFLAADVSSSEADRVAGRFNGNTVDLNRNFDCDWRGDAKWQTRAVSGGSSAFSEPESRAIQAYIETYAPRAVVVWYSAAGGVFASNCHNGILDETRELTNIYAKASGYPAHEDFDFYEVTGDMANWLAKEAVPAISVLLTDHASTEWAKNKAGIEALLGHYAR